MQEILNQLKKLRSIAPSDDFRARSFMALIAAPQFRRTIKMRFLESFSYSLALGLMATVLIVAAGGISYSGWGGLSPVVVGSLNAKSLSSEADGLGASLGLADARYFIAATKDVAMALDAVAKDAPDHLNSGILEQELNGMNIQKDSGANVDELLKSASL